MTCEVRDLSSSQGLPVVSQKCIAFEKISLGAKGSMNVSGWASNHNSSFLKNTLKVQMAPAFFLEDNSFLSLSF